MPALPDLSKHLIEIIKLQCLAGRGLLKTLPRFPSKQYFLRQLGSAPAPDQQMAQA